MERYEMYKFQLKESIRTAIIMIFALLLLLTLSYNVDAFKEDKTFIIGKVVFVLRRIENITHIFESNSPIMAFEVATTNKTTRKPKSTGEPNSTGKPASTANPQSGVLYDENDSEETIAEQEDKRNPAKTITTINIGLHLGGLIRNNTKTAP